MKKLYNTIRLRINVYRFNKMIKKLDNAVILFNKSIFEYDEAVRTKLEKINPTKSPENNKLIKKINN